MTEIYLICSAAEDCLDHVGSNMQQHAQIDEPNLGDILTENGNERTFLNLAKTELFSSIILQVIFLYLI